MKPHLIMPMGGAGSRFYDEGYVQPKPLIEINGKPFFYWATISLINYIDFEDITYVILQQHVNDYGMDKVIRSFFPKANIKIIPEVLPGPVYTALEGISEIVDSAPIIFNDCDHMFMCNELNKMFSEGTFTGDGGLLSFKSEQPQFSYIKFDENDHIIGTVEKKVISNRAICGVYIFKNVQSFRTLAMDYMEHCPYNECFMSGIYNIMCKSKMKIIEYKLDFHVEFGTPKEFEIAKESIYFEKLQKEKITHAIY